jgi:glucosylceramidase
VIADTAYSEQGPVDGWYPQIFYYYMGHFSRYLLPGAVRVGLTNPLDRTGHGGDPEGKAALSPDRTQVVVVVMNRNDSPIQFVLNDAATGRTSDALTLNAHAIHTYWYSVA